MVEHLPARGGEGAVQIQDPNQVRKYLRVLRGGEGRWVGSSAAGLRGGGGGTPMGPMLFVKYNTNDIWSC